MDMMEYGKFIQTVQDSFPEAGKERLELFGRLDGLYREWNTKINVISRKDIDGLYDHHVLHSLAIARYLRTCLPEEYSRLMDPGAGVKVLDLGTGGGFPGIPLAILFPGAAFTLCDSIRKKTVVAREVSEALGLGNVNVVNARAETLPDRFEWVVSRAVASLSEFFPWVRGKYSKGILYLKGGDVNGEISELMGRFRLPKGSISTWRVDSWLDDSYFEEKFVINIL